VGDGAGKTLNQILELLQATFRSVSINAGPEGYQRSRADLRIQIPVEGSYSHDCGGSAELGKRACAQEKARIVRILSQSKKNIIIAGLGRGLGTGGGPLIAAWSKALAVPTYPIVTFPFFFEGQTVWEAAEKGLEEFQRQAISTYTYYLHKPMFKPSLIEFLKKRIPGKQLIFNFCKEVSELCLSLINNGMPAEGFKKFEIPNPIP
jgi:hypothetical protein